MPVLPSVGKTVGRRVAKARWSAIHNVRDERHRTGGLRAHALQTQQAREILGLLCLHGIEKSAHTRNIDVREREILPSR